MAAAAAAAAARAASLVHVVQEMMIMGFAHGASLIHSYQPFPAVGMALAEGWSLTHRTRPSPAGGGRQIASSALDYA